MFVYLAPVRFGGGSSAADEGIKTEARVYIQPYAKLDASGQEALHKYTKPASSSSEEEVGWLVGSGSSLVVDKLTHFAGLPETAPETSQSISVLISANLSESDN